ncbi:MAG TPA: HAD-IIB family hydrolase [Bryobacteraceae bacterium]
MSICNLRASLALACDYDGTIAHRGVVDAATVRALERLRDSGRRLFLVTGRLLQEIERLFPRWSLFDCIVAENGPVLFDTRTKKKTLLSSGHPDHLVDELRKRGVKDITVGEVIVAVWREHEPEVVDAIRDARLDLQLIYNKDSVMMLPPGVDKMMGLKAALVGFALSPDRVIAVGDGENDEPLLAGCGCGIAVANAIPELKAKADFVTAGERGEGVVELVQRALGNC